jgi:PTS system maltose and glucose-specific IIC component
MTCSGKCTPEQEKELQKGELMKKSSILPFFQKLSRAFLIPIALISAGSLALGISCVFQSADVLKALPFLGASWFQYLNDILCDIGLLVLKNLAPIYAVSLAFAFAKEHKEYAAFAGILGYLAFISSMGYLISEFPGVAAMFPTGGISTVLGFTTVNCNIIGGMITGIIVSLVHNKFKDVKLPMAFAFFQGVRFTPIASIFVMYAFGQVFPFAWVWLSRAINALGSAMNTAGVFGPFIYGLTERLLIPTGLHQIWNSLIRTTAISGEYIFASGAQATGVTQAYSLYLAEGLPVYPAGVSLVEMVKYQFGPQMPIMLGALPGACLAMYHVADKDKKKTVKSLLLTAALTAIFAAVSEPVEFVFLFAAPLLYLVYSLLNGLSWLLCYVLGSAVGGGESSIIGLFIHGIFRPSSNFIIILVLIPVYFAACYFLFKWWIVKFNVKTPGRGGDFDESMAYAQEIANVKLDTGKEEKLDVNNPEVLKAQIIIKGLGGKDNILDLEACMSRLRVELKDGSLFDEKLINKTGCNGIVKADDKNVQIVYGTSVMLIKKTIEKELEKM